jgi:hypothetical protein
MWFCLWITRKELKYGVQYDGVVTCQYDGVVTCQYDGVVTWTFLIATVRNILVALTVCPLHRYIDLGKI